MDYREKHKLRTDYLNVMATMLDKIQSRNKLAISTLYKEMKDLDGVKNNLKETMVVNRGQLQYYTTDNEMLISKNIIGIEKDIIVIKNKYTINENMESLCKEIEKLQKALVLINKKFNIE